MSPRASAKIFHAFTAATICRAVIIRYATLFTIRHAPYAMPTRYSIWRASLRDVAAIDTLRYDVTPAAICAAGDDICCLIAVDYICICFFAAMIAR